MTHVNKEFNYLHLSTEKDFLQRVSGFLVLRNIKAKGGIENFEINVENFSHIPDLRRGFSFLFSVILSWSVTSITK